MFKGCLYKGHVNSRKINELVLSMKFVETELGCILHVIHVTGTQMKKAGIDGLSREDLLEVMMNGQSPLDFILIDSAD